MQKTQGILSKLVRIGQIYAFFAVLIFAMNPHQTIALSESHPGHGHLNSIGDAVRVEVVSPENDNGAHDQGAECLHHFSPLVWAPLRQMSTRVADEVATPYTAPVLQHCRASDPPPPRYSA
jgi:hypothetical protein